MYIFYIYVIYIYIYIYILHIYKIYICYKLHHVIIVNFIYCNISLLLLLFLNMIKLPLL